MRAKCPRDQGRVVSALSYAVKLLAGRDKSELKLRCALEKKGFAPPEIDAAIVRLKAQGYLNEARFAHAKVTEGLRVGRTPLDLRQRLVRDGLPEPVIDAALTRVVADSGFDPLTAAKALVTKRRLTGLHAARFLAARGFDDDVIRRLVPAIDEMA